MVKKIYPVAPRSRSVISNSQAIREELYSMVPRSIDINGVRCEVQLLDPEGRDIVAPSPGFSSDDEDEEDDDGSNGADGKNRLVDDDLKVADLEEVDAEGEGDTTASATER